MASNKGEAAHRSHFSIAQPHLSSNLWELLLVHAVLCLTTKDAVHHIVPGVSSMRSMKKKCEASHYTVWQGLVKAVQEDRYEAQLLDGNVSG